MVQDISRTNTIQKTFATTKQLQNDLNVLKKDIATSFRHFQSDYKRLGQELFTAIQSQQRFNKDIIATLNIERTNRMRLQAKLTEIYGNIRVVCQIQPLKEENTSKSCIQVVSRTELRVSTSDNIGLKSFTFNQIYQVEKTQEQVFTQVESLLPSIFEGQHVCFFHYGQSNIKSLFQQSVYVQAVEKIFKCIKDQENIKYVDYQVNLQLVQVYNEEIYDLVGEQMNKPDRSSPDKGEIRHGDYGLTLQNVTNQAVTSPSCIYTAIEQGLEHRWSHSHVVVMLNVIHTSKVDGYKRRGRLVFVDLAGSERPSASSSSYMEESSPTSKEVYQRTRESQNVNRSLCALGDVLTAILSKDSHIPFRNSKLTHLLQESLAPPISPSVLMIIDIAQDREQIGETMNSLMFAARMSGQKGNVSHIKRDERVESVVATEVATIQEKLKAEKLLNRELHRQIEELQKLKGVSTTRKKIHTIGSSVQMAENCSFPLKSTKSMKYIEGPIYDDRENISDNILASLATTKTRSPLKRLSILSTPRGHTKKRRLSMSKHKPLYYANQSETTENGVSTIGSGIKKPSPPNILKRKIHYPSYRLKGILKKRRESVDLVATKSYDQTVSLSQESTISTKQVSFDMSSVNNDTKAVSKLLPPRRECIQPAVSGPARVLVGRVRQSIGRDAQEQSGRTKDTNKPKWNSCYSS